MSSGSFKDIPYKLFPYKYSIGRPLSKATWRLSFQQLLHWGVEEGVILFLGLLHLPLIRALYTQY